MGRIGQVPWNKGKKGVYSKETIARMREAASKRMWSDEMKRHFSKVHTGRKQSLEHIKNKALANIGKHDYSDEVRRRIGDKTSEGMTVRGIHRMAAKKAGYKTWTEYQRALPKWKKYKSRVWSITYKTLRNNPKLPNFELRGKCGVDGAYQIDHILSIHEGFQKNIPPEIIGAYENLQMIPWHANRLKGK